MKRNRNSALRFGAVQCWNWLSGGILAGLLELFGTFCYAAACWLYCWPVVENLIGPHCVFTACWRPLCPTPPTRLYKYGSCLWHYWAWALRWSVLTGACVRRETPAVRTRQGDMDAARFQTWVSQCPDHVTGGGDLSLKVASLTHFYRPIVVLTTCIAATKGQCAIWPTPNVWIKQFLSPGWDDSLPDRHSLLLR